MQQFDVGFHYRSLRLILDPRWLLRWVFVGRSGLLDFVRVRVTRVQQVDLTRVTRDVTALVAAHPDRSDKVRVTCFVPDDGSVHVAGDEDRVARNLQ